MAKGDMTIVIKPEEIMGSEVGKSGDYKYARMGVKKGDSEYLSVSYEWKGDGIPEFVMALMSWMQSNKEEVDKSTTEKAEEYKTLKETK